MIQRILVPVDFSEVTDVLVEKAMKLAGALHARIRLLHVAPAEPELASYKPGPEYERKELPEQRCEDYRHLTEIKERLGTRGLEAEAVLLQGDTVEQIIQEAGQFKADLIVLGSHGHGALHHLLLGSVSEGVLQKAACPVMIIPSRIYAGGERS